MFSLYATCMCPSSSMRSRKAPFAPRRRRPRPPRAAGGPPCRGSRRAARQLAQRPLPLDAPGQLRPRPLELLDEHGVRDRGRRVGSERADDRDAPVVECAARREKTRGAERAVAGSDGRDDHGRDPRSGSDPVRARIVAGTTRRSRSRPSRSPGPRPPPTPNSPRPRGSRKSPSTGRASWAMETRVGQEPERRPIGIEDVHEGAVAAEQRDRLLRGRAEERPCRGRVERDRRDSVAGRRTGLAHPASHLVLGGEKKIADPVRVRGVGVRASPYGSGRSRQRSRVRPRTRGASPVRGPTVPVM